MIGQYDVVLVQSESEVEPTPLFLVRNVSRKEAERVLNRYLRDKSERDFKDVRVVRHGTLRQVVRSMCAHE